MDARAERDMSEPEKPSRSSSVDESVWLEQQSRLKQIVSTGCALSSEAVELREAFLTCSLTMLLERLSVLGAQTNGTCIVTETGRIERAIWKHGFYVVIHEYRTRLKKQMCGEDSVDNTEYEEYIDRSLGWYRDLLDRLEALKGSLLQDGSTKRVQITMSRCYVCIGDLCRYRIQLGSSMGSEYSHHDIFESRKAYVTGIQLCPTVGNPYNQLAVLSGLVEDTFRSLFYYIRAATAREPFPSADENMSMLLHRVLECDHIPGTTRRKKKSSMHDVETLFGNACLQTIAMLYLQVDIDNVLQIWMNKSNIVEEYFNRRLQKIRKIANSAKPVFGKSRKLSTRGMPDSSFVPHHLSKEFQDPQNSLIMVVHSLLLLMQGKLEHAKCENSLRQTFTRAFGYIVILDLTGRVASLLGRCRHLLKQTHNSKCIDIVVSEILVPLLMLLSWISKDWQIHGDASLKNCQRACQESDSTNRSCFDHALKKFLRGILSTTHALSPFGGDIERDNGKLSRLSHSGMAYGCPLLEAILDYPLFVVKRRWEKEYNIPFNSRKKRKKAHGFHLATWTVVHNVWTMMLDVAHGLQAGPVALCLGDTYDSLRMKIYKTAIDKNLDKPRQLVDRNACCAAEEDEEEIIVYEARKPKPTHRGPFGIAGTTRSIEQHDDHLVKNVESRCKESAYPGYYDMSRLVSEMVEEVLIDEDHVGPSNEHMQYDTTRTEIGNMLQ